MFERVRMDINTLSMVQEGGETLISTSESICSFLEQAYGTIQLKNQPISKVTQLSLAVGSLLSFIGGWSVFSAVSSLKTAEESEKYMYHSTRKTGAVLMAAGMTLLGAGIVFESSRKHECVLIPLLSRQIIEEKLKNAPVDQRVAYFMVGGCEFIKTKKHTDEKMSLSAMSETILLSVDTTLPYAKRQDILKSAYDGAYQYYFKKNDTSGLVSLMQEYTFLSKMAENKSVPLNLNLEQIRHRFKEKQR